MVLLLALISLMVQEDEAALRDRALKGVKDKDPARRVEALKLLAGAKEEKSIKWLAERLRDPALEMRKAAAETIGGCDDAQGVAIRPLCAVLTDKKEDPAVRLACAKALSHAAFRADALDALVSTISGIAEGERQLYQFGADVTVVLNGVAGQDFGAGKETPAKWQAWWKENQPRVRKEDADKRAAAKKK